MIVLILIAVIIIVVIRNRGVVSGQNGDSKTHIGFNRSVDVDIGSSGSSSAQGGGGSKIGSNNKDPGVDKGEKKNCAPPKKKVSKSNLR